MLHTMQRTATHDPAPPHPVLNGSNPLDVLLSLLSLGNHPSMCSAALGLWHAGQRLEAQGRMWQPFHASALRLFCRTDRNPRRVAELIAHMNAILANDEPLAEKVHAVRLPRTVSDAARNQAVAYLTQASSEPDALHLAADYALKAMDAVLL